MKAKKSHLRIQQAFWLFLLLLFSCVKDKEQGPRVVGVMDGDTIELLENNQTTKVRLYGIDTPEKNQDFGTRARQLTSDLCFGKHVTLVSHGQDRYGRVVGTIILPDGRSLNQELVRNGLAWHYTAYSKDPELARLEAEARQQGRGLWSLPNPTAPWDFRKNRTAARATTAAAPKPGKASRAAPIKPGDRVYICDSKGATVYHQSSTCTNIKRCKQEIKQVTRRQAEAAGRRGDQLCIAKS